MSERGIEKPWVTLERLIHEAQHHPLLEFLESLSPAETARALGRLGEDEHNLILEILSPEEAANIIIDLPDEQAADIIEDYTPEGAAAIIDELPDDEMADILGEVEEEEAEAILRAMPQEEAQHAREMLAYEEDTAGGIMMTEVLSYQSEETIDDVLGDLRANREIYSDYGVQYAYITDEEQHLIGVLRMRDILLALPDSKVFSLMMHDPFSLHQDTSLEEMIDSFEEKSFLGMPVVDNQQKLIGVVRKAAVMEASEKRSKDTYLKASGIVGGEELRSMPLLHRVSKRLMWLLPSLVLSVLAASVIARYESTLDQLIKLAMFLTIISGLSGNSGNQSVAVSIREMALGLVHPSEAGRVLIKEIATGLLIGLTLGSLIAAVSLLYEGSLPFALVVGGALATNTFISVLLGALIPLLLKKLGFDPALASGPLLTTTTDMCGFFLTLSLANQVLLQTA